MPNSQTSIKELPELCDSSYPPDPTATTAEIIEELMAKGIRADKIRIPGKGRQSIAYISDDFDAPLDELAEYM